MVFPKEQHELFYQQYSDGVIRQAFVRELDKTKLLTGTWVIFKKRRMESKNKN